MNAAFVGLRKYQIVATRSVFIGKLSVLTFITKDVKPGCLCEREPGFFVNLRLLFITKGGEIFAYNTIAPERIAGTTVPTFSKGRGQEWCFEYATRQTMVCFQK